MSKSISKLMAFLLLFSMIVVQGCGSTTQTSDKIKIAYIMDPSGRSNTDNTDVIAAFEEIKSYYDFDYTIYSAKDNDNVKKQVKTCYNSDFDLIIGSSYIVNSELLSQKNDYPNVNIALIGNNDSASLSMSIDFKTEESSFLAGALAASTSKTGIIGYVGGYSDDLVNYEVGYYAGAKTVNPNITVLSNYTNSYNNVTNGYQLAESQIARGADIIYANCGASALGVSNAVSEYDNVYLIDSDLYASDNSQHLLGSVKKDYKKAALYLIDSFINDNFVQNTTRCGIAYDMVDFDTTYLVSDDSKTMLNQFRSQIRQYSVPIPDTWDNYNNFNYYSYITTSN